jgi:ABC-2 type transport system ATP-binding protein
MKTVIDVKNLRKSYGDVAAVDDVSFEVYEGEIFGMVGPNGAGKTTTIECIEGLRQPTEGCLRVLGVDPWRDREALAEWIGIQLQESALPPRLRVNEALALFSAFYERGADPEGLLGRMGLGEKRRTLFSKLSGGQKQRLFIALALINKPRIVFFDELTTGLDPQSRRRMWDLVREIRERGCTVFLTTHYMEEAEYLCDRVLIIDQGQIVALDAPTSLIHSLGVEKRLIFTLQDGNELPSLEQIPQVKRVERAGKRRIVYGEGEQFASSVIRALEVADLDFSDLKTEQANLEDVFLRLTGRDIEE